MVLNKERGIGLKGTGTSGVLLSSQPLSWVCFCLQRGGPNVFELRVMATRGHGAVVKELRLPVGPFVRAWFAPCAGTPLEEPIIPYKALSSFRRNERLLPAPPHSKRKDLLYLLSSLGSWVSSRNKEVQDIYAKGNILAREFMEDG